MHVAEQPKIDLDARARVAIYALATMLVVSAGVVVADILSLPLLDDASDFETTALLSDDFGASQVNAAERYDAVTGIAGLVELVALIGTMVFFVRWFNGAHRMLDRLAPGVRRHSTWWSIGGWFIPVMALFRPKQILNDMLTAVRGDPTRPWWAAAWWVLWLVGSLGGNVGARLFLGADTIDELRTGTIVDACTSLVLIACGVVAIIVVRRVTDGLKRRGRAIAVTPDVPPPGPEPLPAPG